MASLWLQVMWVFRKGLYVDQVALADGPGMLPLDRYVIFLSFWDGLYLGVKKFSRGSDGWTQGERGMAPCNFFVGWVRPVIAGQRPFNSAIPGYLYYRNVP